MTAKTKILSTLGLALSLAASGAGWPGLASATSSAATLPDDDKTILHWSTVSRLAGSRPGKEGEPGDIVKIREMGLQRYIDQQLHPDRIPIRHGRASRGPGDHRDELARNRRAI
jgi:hypothetical protein